MLCACQWKLCQQRKTTAGQPIYVSDEDHYNTRDAHGEVSGAGIATLQSIPDATLGNIYLVAPQGTVDAGAAGIDARSRVGDPIVAKS